MNRSKIKEEAKELIKGNKWNIWWSLLVISFLEGVLGRVFGPKINIDFNNLESLSHINIPTSYYYVNGIIGLLMGITMVGYFKYLLNFVRTKKFNT